jgi:hypothetical protein
MRISYHKPALVTVVTRGSGTPIALVLAVAAVAAFALVSRYAALITDFLYAVLAVLAVASAIGIAVFVHFLRAPIAEHIPPPAIRRGQARTIPQAHARRVLASETLGYQREVIQGRVIPRTSGLSIGPPPARLSPSGNDGQEMPAVPGSWEDDAMKWEAGK